MPEDFSRQSVIDEEHLKLLSLGYMISAAFTAVFSLFGLMYAVIGVGISAAIQHAPGLAANGIERPPAFIGWIFGGIGLVLFLVAIVLAGAKLWAALCIKKRQSRTFCMVIAAISCLEVPYGTVLGALSFIVLGRDSVVRLFNAGAAPRSVA
jgi:hypothetical protein